MVVVAGQEQDGDEEKKQSSCPEAVQGRRHDPGSKVASEKLCLRVEDWIGRSKSFESGAVDEI